MIGGRFIYDVNPFQFFCLVIVERVQEQRDVDLRRRISNFQPHRILLTDHLVSSAQVLGKRNLVSFGHFYAVYDMALPYSTY